MDGRQRGRRQLGQPLPRQRRRVERQRDLDQVRPSRRQRQRQLQLGHHRRGAGHVLHRRLSLVGRQADVLPPHPVDHHPSRPRADLQPDRPRLPARSLPASAGPDPMDGRQRRRRQFGQPLLDTDAALEQQRDLDQVRRRPPPTATAPTTGTPPAWRRARTTSAAISTRTASRPTPTSPSRSPSPRLSPWPRRRSRRPHSPCRPTRSWTASRN